jgi:class 3 adenylate cyclase
VVADSTPRARRLPFSVALVGLVAVVTALTGAVLGGLAWYEQRAAARTLTGVAMAQATRLAVDHAVRFFGDAEPAARLGPQLTAAGVLDPARMDALERYVLAVLRAHPQLKWASYGDRDDRFVGAWRDASGAVYVNRSFPRGGRIRLVEERVADDGRREVVRTDDDHRYIPRERPYFRLAEASRRAGWTDPYRFFEGDLGITCAAPVLDAAGAVRGVFTVDVSLQGLSRFLDGLRVTPRSRVFIASAAGEIVARGGAPDAGDARASDAGLVAAVAGDAGAGARVLERGGERLLARAAPFAVGPRQWRVAILVPEGDFTAAVDARARRAAALGGLALLLAAGAGAALSRWIARPLRALSAQAQRIRDGDLAVAIVPESRDEIGSLARTMAGMVEGLRDRDFIRDVLGRYVSPELARQCLRDRDAMRLGGQIRTVTILMSDLRGFSALSERLGPEAMIGLLNRYLAHMVPVILRHDGTINEFIGDAILVLFGAPVERPDDAERAVRCAWAMQRAMGEVNADSRARGLPELTMGIGLHAGRVVAGNIGTADRIKYGVVGPVVNVAGRIEALTVGAQVLLSGDVLERARHVARAGPPRPVAFKGVGGEVLVYELQGIAGEDAAPGPTAAAPASTVDLPAACYRVEGKRVAGWAAGVRVTRLGVRDVHFEAPADLVADVLDVKLVIDFGDGRTGRGSYARLAARAPLGPAPDAPVRVTAVFTALDDADRERIAARTAA